MSKKFRPNSIAAANRFVAKHYAKLIEERIEKGLLDRPGDWCQEYRLIKGEDLISGKEQYEGEIPERGWDPEQTYKLPLPVWVAHNIERRLRRALNDSREAFIKYLYELGLELKLRDGKLPTQSDGMGFKPE